MLIQKSQLQNYKTELGPKTLNLKTLQDIGLNVPNFFALPSSAVWQLKNKQPGDEIYKELIKELSNLSQYPLFAVRSSALIEDGGHNSQAGQFMTKLPVSLNQVPKAITEILQHGLKRLNGRSELLSIIIQEYIQADVSGVCFTRNPLGSREMVIQYHKGNGSDIVSGKIKPETASLFWNEHSQLKNELLVLVAENCKNIERHYFSPQDIEWVAKNGVVSMLQTRPITTLAEQNYQEFLYLDASLPKTSFLYEKTEICEIAPRPSPFTFNLLEKIYAKGGPVSEVYKKYGITYQPKKILKIIGNQLYVDRQLELQTLFPAYSYLISGKPKISSIKGLWKSIKNSLRLQKLPLEKKDALFQNLKTFLSSTQSNGNDLLADFLVKYQTIFEINLLASKAFSDLEFNLNKYNLNSGILLNLPTKSSIPEITIPPNFWLGNSLEISDESVFSIFNQESKQAAKAQELFSSLSGFAQAYLEPIIQNAKDYNKLREYGRWLTVKYINLFREKALQKAAIAGLNNKKDIYFANLSELNAPNKEVLTLRKIHYKDFKNFDFPSRLTNLSLDSKPAQSQGVSPGQAQGKLIDINTLKSLTQNSNYILYTKILSPDLAEYFPKILGIISEQGGLLSHLAIIAREKGLPVIVLSENLKLKPGQEIFMDADNSSIKVL